MSYYPVLVYIHILLMVFWLGTDVGVFLSALRYIDPRRPVAERAAAMDLGAVLDRYPRVCFVAILPVGLQMAQLSGRLSLPIPALLLAWAVSAVWMTTVVAVMTLAGKAAARPWQVLERVLLLAGATILGGAGAAGLLGRAPIAGWLAGKLVLYGAICLFGLCLDHSFKPVVAAFDTVAAEGSTPEREARLRGRMFVSLAWVLAIYTAVLAAGFLGAVKP